MKEFIDKLISRLLLESSGCRVYKLINPNIEDITEFNAYKKCIEIVNELAEEYKLFGNSEQVKGGWIPFSEKMPKAGTHRDVWISLENEVVSYRARWYLDHFEWDNGFAIKERIVAWMPNDVPAPYTKGESR